jgi:uncharacterized protein involved in type VI secretion and phage assembly
MRSTFQNFFHHLIRHGLEYFGLFYGSYRGTVVDNRDPERLGRLKIRCSAIYGDEVPSYWAWPKVSFAGNQIGFFAIPQIGDGVYIECECGNPKYPIWSGGWWSKPGAKSEVPETARLLPPTNRVWQTASGHRIELDDTTGSEKIKITDKSGNHILIDSTTRNEEHLVQGKKIDQVTSDKEETIGGKKTSTITTDKQETVGGNWTITVVGNASITAPLTSLIGSVKLASQSAVHKLIIDTFIALFNGHTHPTGGGSTGVPNQQAGASHQTINTEAS